MHALTSAYIELYGASGFFEHERHAPALISVFLSSCYCVMEGSGILCRKQHVLQNSSYCFDKCIITTSI